MPPMAASEGTAFAQKGKKGSSKKKKDEAKGDTKSGDKYEKNFFAEKKCFICRKKGHGARKCPTQKKNDSDDSSISSSTYNKKTIEELEKKLKNANKQFTQLKVQMEDDEESDDNDDQSHFQFMHF